MQSVYATYDYAFSYKLLYKVAVNDPVSDSCQTRTQQCSMYWSSQGTNVFLTKSSPVPELPTTAIIQSAAISLVRQAVL